MKFNKWLKPQDIGNVNKMKAEEARIILERCSDTLDPKTFNGILDRIVAYAELGFSNLSLRYPRTKEVQVRKWKSRLGKLGYAVYAGNCSNSDLPDLIELEIEW